MATIDVRHLHIGGNPATFHSGGEGVADYKGKITMVIGGERSGKSTYAEDYALEAAGDSSRYFIATAEAMDDEMSKRILRHQASRAGRFVTIEEPIELAKAIKSLPDTCSVCVVDCLTVWMGNLLYHKKLEGKVDELLDALVSSNCDLIIVTNETGLGVVPADPESRKFVEEAGRLHQKIASLADNVIVMIAGIPLAIKGQLL
ncbi:MAG: bifunctional adenosylcobinamide kinase/adenosylcobinamide-phosphate guanylyltransferase [Sphaerochaetaceae bacterium]|nr:bifunctional adenosylcobinamide kinase/adenosylcobinamide-phosphate guanylyltransferase [Spirochaetales bacterium]MDY5500794.1 bifunctional adenosylcobinamide kinase/adenosylcobinamide-phosphate guanylyltransferase [Sphaerochaetaceae bacterium]